jgi:hypothetical protein
MQAKIASATKQRVTVNNLGGILTGISPITLKNQVVEITSLESIANVQDVEKITGATLVYNESDQAYEVKPLDFDNLSGSVDCGDF